MTDIKVLIPTNQYQAIRAATLATAVNRFATLGDVSSSTTLTASRVAFGSPTNTISSDAELTWNNLTKRLIIGTAAVFPAKVSIVVSGGITAALLTVSDYESLRAQSSTAVSTRGTLVVHNNGVSAISQDMIVISKTGHVEAIGSAQNISFETLAGGGLNRVGKYGMVVTSVLGGTFTADHYWETTDTTTGVLIERMRLTAAAKLTVGTLFSWTEATTTLQIAGTNTSLALVSIRGGTLAASTSNSQINFVTGTGGSPSTGSIIQYHTAAVANSFRNAAISIVRDTAGVLGNILFWQKNVTRQIVCLVNSSDNYTTVVPEMVIASGGVTIGRLYNLAAVPVLSAKLNVGAATSALASINIQSSAGTTPTAPSLGDLWYDGTDYVVRATTRNDLIARVLIGQAPLNFPLTGVRQSSDLTISVTGATPGDPVALGVPNGSTIVNSCYTAWVSIANTVTVRFNNYDVGALDPANGVFRVTVFKN